MSQREAVTTWKNWRDVIATERVVTDLSSYKSTTLHEWPVAPWRHDGRDAGPMSLSSFAVAEYAAELRGNGVTDVTVEPE